MRTDKEPERATPRQLTALVGLCVAMACLSARRSSPAVAGDRPLACSQFGHPAARLASGVARGHDAQQSGAVCFELDGRTRNAAWAMTIITPESLAGEAKRSDKFRADGAVPEAWRATLDDYRGTGLHRGHLIASAHFGDQAEQDATYLLSVVVPQDGDLNSHFWARQIEERGMRGPVREGLSAVVVVAPLYPRARDHEVRVRTVGPHDVWVPDRLAAAVLLLKGGRPDSMRAWIVPNQPVPHDANEADYRVSVDELEREMARDLYYELPDDVENRMESTR